MADAKKRSLGKEFTKGLLKENPVLRLVLGTCPTLAVTTSVTNAIGMGIAATIVLVCSNIVISALRKLIPDKVRIPAYIVIIASFVTIVQMLVKASEYRETVGDISTVSVFSDVKKEDPHGHPLQDCERGRIIHKRRNDLGIRHDMIGCNIRVLYISGHNNAVRTAGSRFPDFSVVVGFFIGS